MQYIDKSWKLKQNTEPTEYHSHNSIKSRYQRGQNPTDTSTRMYIMYMLYCKTLYFRCILISRFSNVEISLHFNLAFSQCSTSIYQAFDGQTEFSWVFNFAISSYSRNSRKFDARENMCFTVCPPEPTRMTSLSYYAADFYLSFTIYGGLLYIFNLLNSLGIIQITS